MKNFINHLALLVTCLGYSLSGWNTSAQGTAFTYQGRLAANGAPANGTYDFIFVLYSAPIGGNQVGPILANFGVAVSDGLFITQKGSD